MAALSGWNVLTEDLSPGPNGLIVGCGEASALMVAGYMTHQKMTTRDVTNMIQKAVQNGQTLGPSGWWGQTLEQVRWDLSNYAIPAQIQTVGTMAQLGMALDNSLAQNIPVILGISQGHFLTGETPQVHGHYVVIWGQDGSGNYYTGDPNTAASSQGQLVTNTLSQLWVAHPFGLVIPSGTLKNLIGGAFGGATNGQTTLQDLISNAVSGSQQASFKSLVDGIIGEKSPVKHLAGFDGVAVSIHEAEQFHFDIQLLEKDNPIGWLIAFAVDSGLALSMRSTFGIVGLFLIIYSSRSLIEGGVKLGMTAAKLIAMFA